VTELSAVSSSTIFSVVFCSATGC